MILVRCCSNCHLVRDGKSTPRTTTRQIPGDSYICKNCEEFKMPDKEIVAMCACGEELKTLSAGEVAEKLEWSKINKLNHMHLFILPCPYCIEDAREKERTIIQEEEH